ncbi:MAG: hypothetical protein Q8L89_01215 [Gammaproteobacteria bacterium]|nr:hypothetical protein [Gammaproteobacteria bacterium]
MTGTLTPEGCTFQGLFEVSGLQRLDARFLDELHAHNPSLHAGLLGYRGASLSLSPLQISVLLLACAPLLEEFIARLFHIETEIEATRKDPFPRRRHAV